MLVSRARAKVRAVGPPEGGGQEHRAVVQAFPAAARGGDIAFTVAAGRITTIAMVTNPSRLASMTLPEPT